MIRSRKGSGAKEVMGIFDSSNESIEAIQLIPNNELSAAKLNVPIYLALITGNYSIARTLSKKAANNEIQMIPGSQFDLHAKMIAGMVLQDPKQINESEIKLFSLGKLHWWEKQRLYFDMYKSVATQNFEELSDQLKFTTKNMRSRASDREFGDQLGEYGGLDYNQFVLDFMALGIVSFAYRLGFRTNFEAEYFPIEIILLAMKRNA
jgi:hypothetical protein